MTKRRKRYFLKQQAKRKQQFIITAVTAIMLLIIVGIVFAFSNSSTNTSLESATFANPNNPNCPDSSKIIDAPTEPRMETALRLDLSDTKQTQFVDLILSANRLVILSDGRILPVSQLQIDDTVFMTGNKIGVVQSIERREYIPEPSQTDENGNVYQRVIGKSQRYVEEMLYLYTDTDLIMSMVFG